MYLYYPLSTVIPKGFPPAKQLFFFFFFGGGGGEGGGGGAVWGHCRERNTVL